MLPEGIGRDKDGRFINLDNYDQAVPDDARECEHCGETFKPDDARAEIYDTNAGEEVPSIIVHAEPCFEPELRQKGYEIA